MKFEQELALCLLGLTVQITDEKTKLCWKKANVSQIIGKIEISKLINEIGNENLFFEYPYFFFSLRIRLCREIIADKDNFERNFIERLKKIFPEKLAIRLACHIFKKMKELLVLGHRAYPAKEEIEIHEKQKDKILSQWDRDLNEKNRNFILSRFSDTKGTGTWFVDCPQCGTSKRCDDKTKTFRCKCGFQRPYPFES